MSARLQIHRLSAREITPRVLAVRDDPATRELLQDYYFQRIADPHRAEWPRRRRFYQLRAAVMALLRQAAPSTINAQPSTS